MRVVIRIIAVFRKNTASQFEYVTHFYMSAGTISRTSTSGFFSMCLMASPTILSIIRNTLTASCLMGDIRFDIEKFCFFDKAVISILKTDQFWPDLDSLSRLGDGIDSGLSENEFQATLLGHQVGHHDPQLKSSRESGT